MTLRIVSTKQQPDLAATTAMWRWHAFFRGHGTTLVEVQRGEISCTGPDPIPEVLVLIDGDRPVGMVTLCLDDLADRPELNPWLAGLYVEPDARGKGHAIRLIQALEAKAVAQGWTRLSLYTAGARDLYRRVGWHAIESFDEDEATYFIMQKAIG